MSDPSHEDSASPEEQAIRPEELDDARRLRKREYNRRYRERHPEQNAAIRRRWVEANRDRIRESNRRWRSENVERARQLNRDAAHRAVLRNQSASEQRACARERARLWRENHLEEVRSYHVQWVAQNREKIREYSTRYYKTHRDDVNVRSTARRDANPERAKQWRKAWAERNKDRLADLQRERRKDPGIYQAQLEANAAARRLKRRLQSDGLPPKQLHPVTAAERRAHEQEAATFFNDPALPEQVRQCVVFTETLTTHLREHEAQMREFAKAYTKSMSRLGLPSVDLEGLMYARAVEIALEDLRDTSLLTSGDVAGAVRSSRATLQREKREQQFDQLVKALVAHVNRHRDRFDVEADIENRARAQRGLARVRVDALLVRLALQKVVERCPTNQLSVADVRSAARSAKARIVTPPDGFSSSEIFLTLNQDSPRATRAINGPD